MAKKKAKICGCICHKMGAWSWVISEVAFAGALFYLLFALNAQVNLWLGTLILFVLINISVMACPIMNKCGCCD